MAAKPARKEVAFKRIELFKDQIIGIGAFGAVCHAQCDDLPCAAKILHPTIFAMAGRHKNAQKFEQEYKFIRTVQHPNIVPYFGIHYDNITGQPVLLMEMMDENLTQFLESSPDKIPYHLQVNICRDIALALSFLHSNGIIHRNLSGNNVLLIHKAQAKVSDFGMDRLSSFDPKRSIPAYTVNQATHPYMPPEVFRNNSNYDEKTDCFSFGVIAVQIMTRKFPRPTDHLKPLDTENTDGILSYVTVPEREHRKGHISNIDPNNPLLPIVLPCLNDDSTQRPSAQTLCKEVKNLQESDDYRGSTSGKIIHSRALNKDASSEKRANQDNQQESDEDAGKSTPNLEQNLVISNRMEEESCITEENVLPDEEHRDAEKKPKSQDVIVIVAEVHPTKDETLPEQSSPSKKDSDQHPSNHQDHKQKLQKASAFDQDEEIQTTTGESVPKSQGTEPESSSPWHENGAEEELRSSRHITEARAAVTTDMKINAREEGENAVQDSDLNDVQQEIQESEDDSTNKKEEERKPVQNADAVEKDLQERKDASVTEQPREESKHKDGASAKELPELGSKRNNVSVTQQPKGESEQDGTEEPPELESKRDNVSVTQQPKQESEQDGTEEPAELESKYDNAEPHKQESKCDDAQPDQESKRKAKEGKEVQTHSGAEMVNNSPKITVIDADSDGGATKPGSSSEAKTGNVHD